MLYRFNIHFPLLGHIAIAGGVSLAFCLISRYYTSFISKQQHVTSRERLLCTNHVSHG